MVKRRNRREWTSQSTWSAPTGLATDSDWFYLTSFLPGLKSAGGTEQILRKHDRRARCFGAAGPKPRLDKGIPFSEPPARRRRRR